MTGKKRRRGRAGEKEQGKKISSYTLKLSQKSKLGLSLTLYWIGTKDQTPLCLFLPKKVGRFIITQDCSPLQLCI